LGYYQCNNNTHYYPPDDVRIVIYRGVCCPSAIIIHHAFVPARLHIIPPNAEEKGTKGTAYIKY